MLVGQPALPVGGRAAVLGGRTSPSPASSTSTASSSRACPASASASPRSSAGPTPCRPATASPPTRSTSCPGRRPRTATATSEQEMTSHDETVEVLRRRRRRSTEVDPHPVVQRTTGPILDFPGVGWTDGDDHHLPRRQPRQRRVHRAVPRHGPGQSLRRVQGGPRARTKASRCSTPSHVSRTARPGTPTPRPRPTSVRRGHRRLRGHAGRRPGITQIAADSGAVLLDGSDPLYEWVDEPRRPRPRPGARTPSMPQVERRRLRVQRQRLASGCPTPTELLEGDYSPLHGRQDTPRSPRTRENATVLDDTSADGRHRGDDGTFDLDELRRPRRSPTGATPRGRCTTTVVERCDGRDGRSTVPELAGERRAAVALPGRRRSTSAEACAVLAGWDGIYDLDSVGAAGVARAA